MRLATLQAIFVLGLASFSTLLVGCPGAQDVLDDICSQDDLSALPDGDGDGVVDVCDNCPNVANSDQADADDDGVGDVCVVDDNPPDNPNSLDDDGDGVDDLVDNCPNQSNAFQGDGDDDGVGNACDNCPATFNPDQANSDGGRRGDACTAGLPIAIQLFPQENRTIPDGSVEFVWLTSDENLTHRVVVSSNEDVFADQNPVAVATLTSSTGDDPEHRLAIDLTVPDDQISLTYYWGVEVTKGSTFIRVPGTNSGIRFTLVKANAGVGQTLGTVCPTQTTQPSRLPSTVFRWAELGPNSVPVRTQLWISRAGTIDADLFNLPPRLVVDVVPPTATVWQLEADETVPAIGNFAWGLQIETADGRLLSLIGTTSFVAGDLAPTGSLLGPVGGGSPTGDAIWQADDASFVLQWAALAGNCEDRLNLSSTVYLEFLGDAVTPTNLFASPIQVEIPAPNLAATLTLDLVPRMAELGITPGRWAWGVVADDGTGDAVQLVIPSDDDGGRDHLAFILQECATDADCADGDACNGSETCVANECQAGTPLVCDDGDLCNGAEVCVPATGCVAGAALVCDDGNVCNGIETCDSTTGCVPGVSLACGDNNACNGSEFCDPVGGCQSGGPLVCSDGKFCNGFEVCLPATGCQPGTPPICVDELACTVDSCSEEVGACVFAPDNTVCENTEFPPCYSAPICDPVLGCHAVPLCDAEFCLNGQCATTLFVAEGRCVGKCVPDGLTWDTAFPELQTALDLVGGSPQLASGSAAAAIGGAQFGDFNSSGRVDLIDYAEVPNCMNGPAAAAPAGCGVFDDNLDANVDMVDMARFVRDFDGQPGQSSITEIWVAQGTYRPSEMSDVSDPRSVTFSLINGITLFGGFCGSETSVNERLLGANPECSSVLTGAPALRNAVAGTSDCCFAGFKGRQSCGDTACANLICNDLGFGSCCTSDWDEDCARRANVYCAQSCSGSGDNAYHVVTGSGNDATAIIDGFVISDGVANGDRPCVTSVSNPTCVGAGILSERGSPTIRNCILRNNKAGRGGAMYSEGNAPVIVDTIFSGNIAAEDGGAMFNMETAAGLNRCDFSGNSAAAGGGVAETGTASRGTYTGCRFTSNRAGSDGGGFHGAAADSSFTNCLFQGNTAQGDGGGVWLGGASTSPVKVTNCTFSLNVAGLRQNFGLGGGILVGEVASLTLINSIVWGNSAPLGTVLDQQVSADGIATVTFSCVQDDVPGDGTIPFDGAVNGNIDLDPVFADVDLRLCAGSPCVDAGDDSAVSPGVTTDLDRRPRVVDDVAQGPRNVDMGAYESPSPDGCQ